MSSYQDIESHSVGTIRLRFYLIDLGRYVFYWCAGKVADVVALVHIRIGALWDLWRGRPETALLRYGRAVRHLQLVRESLATYRRIDRLVARYPALLESYRPAPVKPERFLFFVGYSRSGHSLVGALLDAHPNLLISHELHALRHFERGHSFGEIVAAIQYNSRFFERSGCGYSGYSYEVASQSQGKSSRLRVVGDKKANGTTRVLRRHPEILDALRDKIPVPVVFVHVIRDPFDNIASRALRAHTSLEVAAHAYFANADVIARLKLRHPEDVIDVYLDDLIADPKATLAALLRRLGIADIDDRYLDDCAKIVFRQARRTQNDAAWDPELRRSIADNLGRYSFLRRFAADRWP